MLSGIVLIDSGHPGDIDTVVLPGLVKLGLNPANIKYVLLGHGHSDHYGGAAVLQQRFGARIATTAADWDTIAAEKRATRGWRYHDYSSGDTGPHTRFAGLYFSGA